MFQLHDPQTGRLKAQVLRFAGGVNLQLFDHETRSPSRRAVSTNFVDAEAEALIGGLQSELAESRKVGGNGD